MIEDKWLIWRCKQGNRAAFQRIYEKYEGDLRTLAANLLYDKTMAEDVVHDVFISLLGIVDTFELRSSLAGYLKTCIVNRSRDVRRIKKPKTVLADDAGQAPSDSHEPVQRIMETELSRKLDAAMNRLPYEQKEAIVLYLHGQMKFKTIAKLQNVSIKTAHTRYRAGLDGLRSMLNSELREWNL
ncbi:MAG: sigma-70 family RNA polymerase sigma factor [Sedimentisphaerales bacterium]|nr:sigma-70 family RNA polymerase sigma factor [Sedimentisphaerales bacterium]